MPDVVVAIGVKELTSAEHLLWIKCFTCSQSKQQPYKVGIITLTDRKDNSG